MMHNNASKTQMSIAYRLFKVPTFMSFKLSTKPGNSRRRPPTERQAASPAAIKKPKVPPASVACGGLSNASFDLPDQAASCRVVPVCNDVDRAAVGTCLHIG